MHKRRRTWFAVLLAAAVFAAACSDGGDDDAEPDTSETTQPPGDTSTTSPPTEASLEGLSGDALLTAFQDSFPRDGRFTSREVYCKPGEEPAEPPTATDPGITEDSITVVHLRSKLEDLETIGFAVPLGDPADVFEVFVDMVNNDCGGINGRTIDLQLVEVSALGGAGGDIDTLRNAACLQATEDVPGVIVVNATGFQGSAVLCLTEDHDAIFLTSSSATREYVERSAGRIFMSALGLTEALEYAVRDLGNSGELEGKTIGVVGTDVPGEKEAVQEGLVDLLETEFGIEVARFDIIGCAGQTSCTEGVTESVTAMLQDGVDVIFPVGLNVVSLPGYIGELATQGAQPGQIQFYNVGWFGNSSDIVSSKVIDFGGEAAGAIYDGAIFVDPAQTGNWRLPEYEQDPVGEMCNEIYAERSTVIEQPYDVLDEADNPKYGMVASVCNFVRMTARSIEAAGPNPTRADIAEAMANLGPVDIANGLPASFAPDKFSAPDSLSRLEFNFPCPLDPDAKSCILPTSEPRAIDRG